LARGGLLLGANPQSGRSRTWEPQCQKKSFTSFSGPIPVATSTFISTLERCGLETRGNLIMSYTLEKERVQGLGSIQGPAPGRTDYGYAISKITDLRRTNT